MIEKLKREVEEAMDNGRYNEVGDLFLAGTGSKLDVKFLRNGKHFGNDDRFRDVYSVTLSRGSRSFTFDYGQSVAESQYYQDVNHKERTYTLDGGRRTGNYSITDIKKYEAGGNHLKLMEGTPPTAYDILTCLSAYDPGTLEDFCDEFGLDIDSKKAEKTYNAVKEEFKNVCMLFSDEEIEVLQLIN